MSDSDDCFVRQAFDVDLPDDFDPLEVPTDGRGYLQNVIYEANHCPDVVVADVGKLRLASSVCKQLNNNSECRRIPTKMMLSLDDQHEEVAEFSKVRQKVARERARNPNVKRRHDLPQDLEAWHKFCFGDNSVVTEKDGLREGVLPLFSILASLSQCEVLELLDYHIEYLESLPALSNQQAVWLYALLVFTELPILPDTCNTLRTLARMCASIRETLNSVHDPQLPALNLFICLVARYFHQTDLGDNPISAGPCEDVAVSSKPNESTVPPACRELIEAYVNYSNDSDRDPNFQPGSSSDSSIECSSKVYSPCSKHKHQYKKRCNSEHRTDSSEQAKPNSIKPTGCTKVDQHITEMPQEKGNLTLISEQCEDCADILDSTTTEELPSCSNKRLRQHRGKKRKFKSIRQEKEELKIKRNKGEEYVTAKGKTIHQRRMMPLNHCRMKCNERMMEDKRKSIFGCYWGLGNYDKRVTIVASLLQICPKKTSRPRTKDADKSHYRQITIQYHLIVDGTNVTVCKGCFLETLGETNKFVKMVVIKKGADQPGLPAEDCRGKQSPKNKTEEVKQVVISHLLSIPSYESHYTRRDSRKKYLPQHWTLAALYEDYKKKNPDKQVNRKYYETQFHHLNLSIKRQNKDTCQKCDRLNTLIQCSQDKTILKQELEHHHIEADAAYNAKDKHQKGN